MSDALNKETEAATGSGVVHAPVRAWAILVLLMLVYGFSWMDRYLLLILIDPISKDLHVSNTQIGLLTGFGASLLYSLAGFPIARWADRGNRVGILALALGLWSAFTAVIGLARSFMLLALSRCGIAVASAGCSPAAYSMISDLFPAARRGTAIAIYSLGISLGTWAGLTFGGVLADTHGWRTAFMVMGIPGMLFALAFAVWVREPRRGGRDAAAGGGEQVYSWREAWAHARSQPAFLAITFGFGFLSFAMSSFENWVPTYMIRDLGLSAAEVGSISGLFQGVVAVIGGLLFGVLADVLGRRDRRWYVWIPMLAFVVALPALLLFFQTRGTLMYGCYMLVEFCASAYAAPLFAASQSLLPARLRALGMATVLCVLNIVGMGAGPSLTGWLSDVLGDGAASLGQAIQLVQFGGLVGLAALGLAARHLGGPEPSAAVAAPRTAA